MQLAAFRSWKKHFPKARILLFGQEQGTQKVCSDLGLESAGPVRVEKQSGAALVSDMFQKVSKRTRDLLCFVNSDIFLGKGGSQVVSILENTTGPFLASGRRYCLSPFQPGSADKEESLEAEWSQNPRWGHKSALDYFIFRGIDFTEMPDFTIGHCAWDNWMMWHARKKNIKVLDLSLVLRAYHFDHDYAYSRGNSSLVERAGELEARNLELLGNEARRFHIGHSTHFLQRNKIRKRKGLAVWKRRLDNFRLNHPKAGKVVSILQRIFHPLFKQWEKATNKREQWNSENRKEVSGNPSRFMSYRVRFVILIRKIFLKKIKYVSGPLKISKGKPSWAQALREAFCLNIQKTTPCLPKMHPHMAAKIQRYDSIWIGSLSHVFVYGPTIGVVAHQNHFLADISIEWGRRPENNWTFRRLILPKPRILKDRSLLLASTGAETYFHWMTDVLPRLEIAKIAGFDPSSFDHIIVNQITKSFQMETLKQLAIPIERCRTFGDFPSGYLCESLTIPSLPAFPGNVTPETIAFLRKLFPIPAGPTTKKIFIGRNKHSKRKMIQESRIWHYLCARGFEKWECDELSVEDQARLFASAGTVVIAHGAAATNLVFCQPGTRVIELFGPGYVNPCYKDLCSHVGLYHAAVIGDGKDWRINLNHDSPDEPITASLELLQEVLEN